MSIEAKIECLKMALALSPSYETPTNRTDSVVKIATTLYAFAVSDEKSSPAKPETSPERTLHLRGKK